jgi:uncharacterized DUF497 family protein
VAFEWDAGKNARNIRKHGIHFADAVAALEDEHAITIRDEYSADEERFISLGLDSGLQRWWSCTHIAAKTSASFRRVWPSHKNASYTRHNYERTIRLQQRQARPGCQGSRG